MKDYALNRLGLLTGIIFSALVIAVGTAIFPGNTTKIAIGIVIISVITIAIELVAVIALDFWRRTRDD